jgi:hypothetical protein
MEGNLLYYLFHPQVLPFGLKLSADYERVPHPPVKGSYPLVEAPLMLDLKGAPPSDEGCLPLTVAPTTLELKGTPPSSEGWRPLGDAPPTLELKDTLALDRGYLHFELKCLCLWPIGCTHYQNFLIR